MIEFFDALKLCKSLPKITPTHKIPLFEAHNTILATDIYASFPLPPFDNSAMDGYAIRLNDFGKQLICDGSILAGVDSSMLTLAPGHTYKVMTGSMLPQNTESVVQKEWVSEYNNTIQIPASESKHKIQQGQNIRFKGEEIAQNQLLLKSGKRLNHLDISILASQGISELLSFAPLKIGIYSSGDEVIEPGSSIAHHQIYNTNATSLYTLLHSKGFACTYNGILRDDKTFLRTKIDEFTQYDVIITSGGASVGDADLIKQALYESHAEFIFDGINAKPGRHLALARLKNSYILLLPGNPLALLLHLHSFVLPFLEALQGSPSPFPTTLQIPLQCPLTLKPNTTTMLLGRIVNGAFVPHNGGKIGSSSLTTMWRNEAIALFYGYEHLATCENINIILYNADYSCDIMDFLNCQQAISLR